MRKLLFLIIIIFALTSANIYSQITSKRSGSWNSTSTWNGGAVPTSSDAVVISDGTTVTVNTNALCKSLTIGSGFGPTATLNFDNSARTLTVSGSTTGYVYIASNGVLASTSGYGQTIYIAGDLTNYGTMTQGTSNTINFNGSSFHSIYGNDFTFNNLTINNAGGIAMTSDITINGTLTLTSGLFYTTNDTLTIKGSISVTSPSATKMIVLDDGVYFGRLKMNTATNKSYTFPIGDTRSTDEYSPVTINLTSGAGSSAYISVNMRNQKDPNNTSSTNYLNRAWTFTPSGLNSFAYDISLTYVQADVTGTESLLYFGKFDNGIWSLLGQPNTITNTYSITGLTNFSTFTGGEAGSLPVRLQSLSSTVSGRDATISWITTSEVNNKGFDILRATVDKDGNTGNYENAGYVTGNGTSNQVKSYTFIDKNLNTGKYVYKLKQTDFNGNFEYFSLNGTVEIGLPGKINLMQNYPNPFNPVTKINFNLPTDSKVTLAIYDITGKEVAKLIDNEMNTAGYHTVEFNGSRLSSGIYLYKLSAGSFTSVKKMTLVK